MILDQIRLAEQEPDGDAANLPQSHPHTDRRGRRSVLKFVLITKDDAIEAAARAAFPPGDSLLVFDNWQEAMEAAEGADLMFVDQIATLTEPHRVAGYEAFADAKMGHELAAKVPLVLIAPCRWC